MSVINIRTWLLALTCGLALVAGTASATLAQPTNDQSGLINVNLQEVLVQVPISVALPIGVAANVCNVSVIEFAETGPTVCDAENNSIGVSRAVADAVLGTSGGNGGGARNQQSGLVNVNIQELTLQVPVSLAVPVGIAANVCNVSVLEFNEMGRTECDAQNTSRALSNSLARAILAAN